MRRGGTRRYGGSKKRSGPGSWQNLICSTAKLVSINKYINGNKINWYFSAKLTFVAQIFRWIMLHTLVCTTFFWLLFKLSMIFRLWKGFFLLLLLYGQCFLIVHKLIIIIDILLESIYDRENPRPWNLCKNPKLLFRPCQWPEKRAIIDTFS
jgi:hypothetical protein